MRKKILFIVILIIGAFFMGRQVGLNTESGKTTIITTEEKATAHDIK